MKVLGIICARGGSKGVPNKNIRELAGQPLIVHTIAQALASDLIDKVIVSTDSKKIAQVARQAGAEVPFIRPAQMANDVVTKLPALVHAVQHSQNELNFDPELVVDLDPTAPLRSQEDIEKCIKTAQAGEVDLVITGYKANKNPYFNMIELDDKGYVKLSKQPDKPFTRRQDAPLVYCMNASIYVWRTEHLLKTDRVIGGKVKFVEMAREGSIDIDSELDFRFIEFLIKNKIVNL